MKWRWYYGAVTVYLYDREETYVKKLSAYLNRMGQGQLQIIAGTQRESFCTYIGKGQESIFVTSDDDIVDEIDTESVYVIWLKDYQYENINLDDTNKKIASISRYAGGKAIYQIILDQIHKMRNQKKSSIPVIAIYSPVGRCGKTQLGLTMTAQSGCKWMYIGMEEYGVIPSMLLDEKVEENGDTFFYYLKERNLEKLSQYIEQYNGVIPSTFSPFDSKELSGKDWNDMIKLLRKYTNYAGVIFDIGMGMITDLACFDAFDKIWVPYLTEENAHKKKEKFESFMKANGLYSLLEKIRFINMDEIQDVENAKKEFGAK